MWAGLNQLETMCASPNCADWRWRHALQGAHRRRTMVGERYEEIRGSDSSLTLKLILSDRYIFRSVPHVVKGDFQRLSYQTELFKFESVLTFAHINKLFGEPVCPEKPQSRHHHDAAGAGATNNPCHYIRSILPFYGYKCFLATAPRQATRFSNLPVPTSAWRCNSSFVDPALVCLRAEGC